MVTQKITIRFAKKGMMRFISHLDLMRLFQRASRRGGIPVVITQGFNPHPRMSIQPAIKLGLESNELDLTIKIDGLIDPEEIKKTLEKELPEGIELLKAEICR